MKWRLDRFQDERLLTGHRGYVAPETPKEAHR